MKNSPVQVTRDGDNINIKAFVDFTGDANQLFPNTKFTYAEVAYSGIVAKWDKGHFQGTTYDFGAGRNMNLTTKVYSHNYSPQNIIKQAVTSSEQRFFKINIDNSEPMTILGYKGITIFGNEFEFDRQVCNKSGGWSVAAQGQITMYKDYNGGNDYSQDEYAATTAHEFGHILGLNDAYEGGTRPAAKVTPEVPKGEWLHGDIMRNNGFVTPNDVEMVWEAWRTNTSQHFQDHDGYIRSSVIKM